MMLLMAVIFGVLLKIVSLYFFSVSTFLWKKPAQIPRKAPRTRFAVVTAARNEEAVIGGFVESIKKQDYPDELFDVYVVPNQCSDGTEERAREAGARIISCSGAVSCKGDVLHEAFRQLLEQNYDAVCVFDADNAADSHFLSRMNDAFLAGARVAKGRQEAKNPEDSWVAACYGLYFDFFRYFFNRPRAACGLSAKLVGTGFAVHREVIERMGGWNTETIAEDAEFSAQCAALGERIWWVEEAVTYDEQPTSFRVSLIQRKRWCSGVMQVAKKQMRMLIRSWRENNRALVLDFIMFLTAPFAQAFSLVPLALTILAAVGGDGTAVDALTLLPLYLALSYGAVTALAWGMQKAKGVPVSPGMWKGIFTFGIFMAAWIPLQMYSLCRETKKWEEIRHVGGSLPHRAV
ncbi:glycosyltransferase [Anaerotignum lactatifermentans]|uniref:Glycosyltransferase n=1 Tax=Anaerotignum lactatifermentans TaxID=160404 RepID=A0ABS2GDE9_9FIRM|nr:glycosyltransferase family 2 protein [Anaerotignum lactatifermentans]MBM6828669.1 glycosyltransferase [Anaerotignum lactatifermentans]MBM6878808.1 glycosyltransferase [Anaerotignum lactatifermentans]MBM6950251.1 glycosyltransferase [Anaerotignum lactatifermentans]